MAQNRAVLEKQKRFTSSALLSMIVCIISVYGMLVPTVLAASSKPAKKTQQAVQSGYLNVSNSRLTANDKTFTPQDNNFSYYFNIPKWGKPKDVSVYIDYRCSSRLIHPSSLTLSVDNTPQATAPLDGTKNTSGTLKELISAANLKPGAHLLTVSVHLRSSNNVCTDYQDPGDWAVLLNTSTIHIDYAYNPKNVVINEYPFPFLLTDTISPWKLDLVVPNQPTADDLNAAETIVANWSRQQYIQPSSVEVMTADQWNGGKDGKSFIFVGAINEMPSGLQSTVKTNVPAADGFLQLLSIGDETGLLVTASRESSVVTSAEALSYPKLVQQLDVKQVLITPDMVNNAKGHYQQPNDLPSLLNNNKVTLKQLGYSTQTIGGYGVDSTSFSVQTPLNWAYAPGAGVELYVKNSPLLQNGSALTVSINGNIAKTIPLSHQTAGGESYFVAIPANVNPGEDLNVSIQANLDIVGGICQGEPDGRRYVTIEPTSYFLLPHHFYSTTALASFPNLFIGNNDNLENSYIIVPPHATQNELTAALQVAATASAYTTHGNIPIALDGSQNQLNGQNLILISSNADNTKLKELESAEQYPLLLSNDDITGRGVPVATPTSDYGGFAFQVYRPKGGVVMVLAARDETALQPISQAIADSDTLSTLTSDSFLETQDAQSVSLNLSTKPYETPIAHVKSVFGQIYDFIFTSGNNRVLYCLAFAISLFGIAIYFIWIAITARRARKNITRRQRRKNKRGKH
jgi:hypothetical protein